MARTWAFNRSKASRCDLPLYPEGLGADRDAYPHATAIARFHSRSRRSSACPSRAYFVEELEGTIVFGAGYRNADALRGLDAFDYLWLIWAFSANRHKGRQSGGASAAFSAVMCGGASSPHGRLTAPMRWACHRCGCRISNGRRRWPGHSCSRRRPDGWHAYLRHQALCDLCRLPRRCQVALSTSITLHVC